MSEPLRWVGRTTQQLRSDCLRLMAHDLNNPLTAIRILSEMLRDQLDNTEARQDIVYILEAADLAGALMDSMSSMVLLESQDEEFTFFPVDLVQVLMEAVDRPALRRHFRFELPREIAMNAAKNQLLRAFTDIFLNARKLVDSGAPIRVRAQEDKGDAVVRVHHPGEGIPAAMRDAMFELFGSVELRKHRIPVAAAGLVYARSAIEQHDGTIAFEDAPTPDGPGMDLVIRLPR